MEQQIELDNSSKKNIEYYKNKFKMGNCVVLANEYASDNPENYKFYVFRMLGVSGTGRNRFNVPLYAVYFKEKMNGEHSINSHVFLSKDGKITNPSFGIENKGIDYYLIYLLKNQYVEIKPEYKEILFDIQELEEQYKKQNFGKYNNNYNMCTFVYNLETEKIISM